MLTDPSRLVRAVASGKAKGAGPGVAPARDATRRAQGGSQAAGGQVRPAAGVHLQPRLRRGGDRRSPGDAGVDARRVPTRPEPPSTARRRRSRRRRAAMRVWELARRDRRGGALAARDQIGRGRGQPLAIVAREREEGRRRGGVTNRPLAHDRQKSRLLSPSDPFLHVGVSTKDGAAIKANRRDKYKQVEEFLRLVDAAVDAARTGGHMSRGTSARPTRLVDLGCGNAYLTFGAYALLNRTRGQPLEVVGVDVKRQARETNRRVASALGWERDCVFVEGTIAGADLAFPTPREGDQSPPGGDQSPPGKSTSEPDVDIVLALHACDTATDEALVRAVRWNAPLTLVAPCCHHDLQTRVRERRDTVTRALARADADTASFARGSATSSPTRSARTSCDCWGTGWTWSSGSAGSTRRGTP